MNCSGIIFLASHILYQVRGEKGAGNVKDHIWQRVVDIGNYILNNGATVRDTAKVFGVSKSTVHKDVTERLPKVNQALATEVKKVLEVNKAERHLRGGEATRQKFLTNRPV
jgi:putative DeoR family transcriptional regulator (stage III sporulation protein D)